MAIRERENLPSQTGGFDPDLVLEMERLTGLRREELFRGIAPDVANTILGPRTAISPEREFEIRQELIGTMEELAATAQKRDQVTMEAWYKLKVQAMKSASQVEAAGVAAHGRTQAAHISGQYRQAATDSQALERAYSSLRGNTSKDTITGANSAITTLTAGQGTRRGAALLRSAAQKNNFVQDAVRFMGTEQGQNDMQRQAYLLRVSNNTGVPITDLIAAIKTSPKVRLQRTQILGPDGNRLDGLMGANMPLGNISTLQDSIDRNIAEAARRSAGSRGGNAVATGLLSAVGSSVPGEVPLDSLQTLGVTAEMIEDPNAAQTMEDAAQAKINDLFEDLSDAVERTPYIQGQIDSIMVTAGIQGAPFREYLVSNGLNPDSPADLEAGFQLLEDEYADVREYESGQAKLRAQVARERQKAELRKRKEYEAAMGPERMAAREVVQGIDLEELPEAEEGPSGYAPPQRVGMGLREDQMNNMRVIEDRLRAAADQAEEAGDTDRARYLRREADRYLQLQSDVTGIQLGIPGPSPEEVSAAQRGADQGAALWDQGEDVATYQEGGEIEPTRVGDSDYFVVPGQEGQLFQWKDGKLAPAEPPTERRPDDFATDYEDLDMEAATPEGETPIEEASETPQTENVEAEITSLNSAGATNVSAKIPGDDYSPYATFSDGSYGFIHPETNKLVRVKAGSTAHTSIGNALGASGGDESIEEEDPSPPIRPSLPGGDGGESILPEEQLKRAVPSIAGDLKRRLAGISDPAQAMEIINAYTAGQRGATVLEMLPEDLKRTIERFKTAETRRLAPSQVPVVGGLQEASQAGLAADVGNRLQEEIDTEEEANIQEDLPGDYSYMETDEDE